MDILKDIFKDHVCKFLGKCLMHSDYSINERFLKIFLEVGIPNLF